MAPGEIAVFPLGSVLLPHGVLPLHVFEPRYRALMERVLTEPEPEFGVVLIERGSEVGGGESRFDRGTMARIVEAARLPDGRYAITTVGTRRFRVRRWLDDDPYPRAEVELLPEQAPGPGDDERRAQLERGLRRVLALAAELGADVGRVELVLSDDPVRAGWEAAGVAPIGALDCLEILAIEDPSARLDRIVAELGASAELLALRLGDPGADPSAE